LLAILDGSFLLHRALHVHTGPEALVFMQQLSVALHKVSPTQAFCAWDGVRSKHRREIFPGYKQHGPRKDTSDPNYPVRFDECRALVHRLLPALGVRSLILGRCEGDDVMYRARRAFRKLHPYESAVIVSEDRDLWQLVTPRTAVYRPIHKEWITHENRAEKSGCVNREEFLLMKSLMGDSSDAIPGVGGVGDKRALTLVQQSRSLTESAGLSVFDAAAKTAAEMKETWAKSIVDGWKTVERNYRLMDLRAEPMRGSDKQQIRASLRAPCRMRDLRQITDLLTEASLRSLLSKPDWLDPFRRLL